jgi:hypothetical protein
MSYVIHDEPAQSRLRHLAVRPQAPLLGGMLAGAWLAWPWFALNAFALGSPTRRKELAMCATAIAGSVTLALILVALMRAGVIVGRTQIRLALLVVSTWKLTWAYAIATVQGRTFHVYEYYGGVVANPRVVFAAGIVLRGVVIGLVDSDLWVIIVAGGI